MAGRKQELFNETQIAFIQKLISYGEIDVNQMADELNVTKSTIYNYYNYMKDLSFTRSKGKIVLKRQSGNGDEESTPEPLARRHLLNSKEKEICAHYVAQKYIENGDAIFLDSGSASIYVADQIREQEIEHLTVVTTNPYVFQRLFDYRKIDKLMVVGGESKLEHGEFQGAWTNKIVKDIEFNFQTSVIEISGFGIHKDSCVLGVSDPSEVSNKLKIMERSDQIVFPVDSSKMDKIVVELSRKDESWDNFRVVLGINGHQNKGRIDELRRYFQENLIFAQ